MAHVAINGISEGDVKARSKLLCRSNDKPVFKDALFVADAEAEPGMEAIAFEN